MGSLRAAHAGSISQTFRIFHTFPAQCASAPDRFRKARPALAKANSTQNRGRKRRSQRRPGACQTQKLRCLQHGSEECPAPHQPSSPPSHHEAEEAFAFAGAKRDPTFFRDDSGPAESPVTPWFVLWISTKIAPALYHARSFSSPPSWREPCGPVAASARRTFLQNSSFSLVLP